MNASGSSGATTTPQPVVVDDPADLGVGVDRGHDGTAGGEDRVDLGRHAHPTESATQRHDVDVAGREHLVEPAGGLMVAESHVGEIGCVGFELRARRAVAVDHERGLGDGPGGGDEHLERLREADVAGVQHDRFVADRQLAPVRASPAPWDGGLTVSTKFGITRTFER